MKFSVKQIYIRRAVFLSLFSAVVMILVAYQYLFVVRI